MTRRIWRHIWGYVIIKIKGPRLERFLNRLAAAGIPVWRAERIAPHMLVAAVSVKSFKKMRRLSRAQGWHISILEKVGLPFVIGSIARRKMFLIGCLWAMLMVYAASGMIWFVRIEIDDVMIPEEHVLSVVSEYGLKPGVRRENVNRHQIRQALLLEINELSWASVEVRGVLATVDVYGRAGMDVGATVPGDIVATEDGIVTNVFVLSGQSVVEEGDVVKRGDLLISGFIPPSSSRHREMLERGEPPYERADGIVLARTWIERTVTVPLVNTTEEPTGRRSRFVTFQVGDRTISIGRRVPPFDTFRTEISRWNPGVGPWHASVTVTTHEEVSREFSLVSENEALDMGRKAVLQEIDDVFQAKDGTSAELLFSTELVELEGMPALEVTARVETNDSISGFRETVF